MVIHMALNMEINIIKTCELPKIILIWINHVDFQYLCGLPYGFCAADGFPCGLPQYTLHCRKTKKYGLPYELVVNP